MTTLRTSLSHARPIALAARRAMQALAMIPIAIVLSLAPAMACPSPPPAVRDLAPPRFYSDPDGTVIDPELLAEHRGQVEPLAAFLRHVTQHADKANRRTSPSAAAEAADCAVRWLESWAAQGAWLGDMGSRQGEYQRKWDLAGVALTYSKVRRFATPEARAVIEPWLVRMADAATRFFDDRNRQRNNHWYWLGLGLGATALATDSPRHWDMARSIMGDAAADIRADGALPLELARKSRALQYHAFSLMPLVVLAELARSRGEDWYAMAGGALHRLADLTMRSLADPRVMDALAGAPQDRPTRPGAGWLQLYAKRFPDRIPPLLPDIAPGHRWLGGDVGVLSQTLDIAK